MATLVEAMARAIGECYDGVADPIETPNNWIRAVAAAEAALAAWNAHAIEEQRQALRDMPTVWCEKCKTNHTIPAPDDCWPYLEKAKQH